MKKVGVVLIIFILITIGVETGLDYFSDKLVYHLGDVGNSLNTADLNFERVTMLHWYDKALEIYSEDSMPFDMVYFRKNSGCAIYMDKIIRAQNMIDDHQTYYDNTYLFLPLEKADYKNGKVNLRFEIIDLDNLSVDTLFIGTFSHINTLIATKMTLTVLAKIIIFIGLVGALYFHREKFYLGIFALSVLVMFFYFDVGLLLSVTALYFVVEKHLHKRFKKYFLLISMILCLIIPSSLVKYVFFLIGALLFYEYYRTYEVATFLALLTLAFIGAFLIYDYSFSYFALFSQELMALTMGVFAFALSVMDSKKYTQKDKLIRVDLLRSVSHDIRIPLSTIRINTELLAKEDYEVEVNKGRIIGNMLNAIEDMTHLVSSLSAYISGDHYVSKQYKTSVISCLEKSVLYFKQNLKKIDIQIQFDEIDTVIGIDEIWLNRLIFNLIDNAYKYTEEYGVIKIKYEKRKEHAIIIIEDSGIGISEDQLGRVLEPFYRADHARQISGLGLGLSIVKSIVDNLEGHIQITSQLGVGTKVEIEI